MQNTSSFPPLQNCSIAVIGMGYVGLPLALEFSKVQKSKLDDTILDRRVIGFDINKTRLQELNNNVDRTNEIGEDELRAATNITFTDDVDLLSTVDVYIVTVPTPVDSAKRPDLLPLKRASQTVGKALRKRQARGSCFPAFVIYESTVFPGATEEVCVPILEEESHLTYNCDFFCGYSPERINPGDKVHSLTKIIKVTSGSTSASSDWIDQLYGSIIAAGTHKSASLKVAEAAKVIENTQRDLNIALINEFSIIFQKLGIDTLDTLEAAGTKWNFLPFKPGLVGGHCIGVDPYYLTFKSESVGYTADVILASRRINDGMGIFVAKKIEDFFRLDKSEASERSVTVLGTTFKEDCPDLRNSRVFDIISYLKTKGVKIQVCDPVANTREIKDLSGIEPRTWDSLDPADVVVLAVSHSDFRGYSPCEVEAKVSSGGMIVDIKSIFAPSDFSQSITYWRL